MRRIFASGLVAVTIAAGVNGTQMAAQAEFGNASQTVSPKCLMDVKEAASSKGLKAEQGLLSGEAAIAAAGDNIKASARAAGTTVEQLEEQLRTDSALKLDGCGYPVYVDRFEPQQSQGDVARENAASAALPTGAMVTGSLPKGSPFRLNSRPRSNHVIYLDFTGHSVTGTMWNQMLEMSRLDVPPYSIDGDPSFSPTEKLIIKDVWRRVSEHFASLDVDVTTQAPSASDITRDGPADDRYGIRVLISDYAPFRTACGCSGMAVLGAFGRTTFHEYTQPAWAVPTDHLLTNTALIAGTITHETGHTLGLAHDGAHEKGHADHEEYYSGHGIWQSIMGGGGSWGKPLEHWSKGEYPNANNKQDDFVAMADHGLSPAADDHGNEPRSASKTRVGRKTAGVISTRRDSDWFRFRAGGRTRIKVEVNNPGASLDAKLTLGNRRGKKIATDNPPPSLKAHYVARGLGAKIKKKLKPGRTYSVRVTGTGHGTAATGYSDYGSLGRYWLRITGDKPQSRKSSKAQRLPAFKRSSIKIKGGPGKVIARFDKEARTARATGYQMLIKSRDGDKKIHRTRRIKQKRLVIRDLSAGRYKMSIRAHKGKRKSPAKHYNVRVSAAR